MKHENIEENTTASPASSASLSICCAIGNEETADGEAKMAINVTSSISRKPSRMPTVSPIAGTTANLPMTQIAMSFLRFAML